MAKTQRAMAEPGQLHGLGVMAHRAGRHGDAIESLSCAIALLPGVASYHSDLGAALQAAGDIERAESAYRMAIALDPECAEAHLNLGTILQTWGLLDEALEHCRRAVALKPDVAEVHLNLAGLLAERARGGQLAAPSAFGLVCGAGRGGVDEAEGSCRRAIELKPGLAEAHYNMGNIHHLQRRLEDAAESYGTALALRPRYAKAQHNLGQVLREMGRVDEALACYETALLLQAKFDHARFSQGLALLLRGDLAAGWTGYEYRWHVENPVKPMRAYPQPRWRGEACSGPVLVWGEQGVGDEVMFAGLIPDLVRRGVECIVDCEPRLKPLLARSFAAGGVRVISTVGGDELPEFAAHSPCASLAGVLRPGFAEFAHTTAGYLRADAARRAEFRARYSDGRPVIGLAWGTTNRTTGPARSIALDLFRGLTREPGARWIGLQYGDRECLEAQVKAAGVALEIDGAVDQRVDVDLFAAQVAAMDLVITIDNSTAHLAGALGVPVWLLLPLAADWRWLMERADSPWYPGMRIFRQSRAGDWPGVLRRVGEELRFHLGATVPPRG